MTTNEITMIAITPAEGMWLTQVNVGENDERIFSTAVYCPEGQETYWHEVSEQYKQEWEQMHPTIESEEDGV